MQQQQQKKQQRRSQQQYDVLRTNGPAIVDASRADLRLIDGNDSMLHEEKYEPATPPLPPNLPLCPEGHSRTCMY
jgi:hypothetical protein